MGVKRRYTPIMWARPSVRSDFLREGSDNITQQRWPLRESASFTHTQALINVLLSGACSQIAILQQLARDSVTPYPKDGAKEVRETTGQHGHHRGALLHLG